MRVQVSTADPTRIAKRLRALGSAGIDIGKRVLTAWAEPTVALAQSNAPTGDEPSHTEGGPLKGRIRATRVNNQAGVIGLAITADLAVIQHEDMSLKHNDGGPKFLERAVMEREPLIVEAVKAELDKVAHG